jgi:Holliday junction DNA helicase RuvA
MIGRLKGTVASESPDGTLVVDVNGVGYEVIAPLGTVGRAPRDADGRVTVLIHTNVREDAIVLFGFPDERERSAFRLLITVAGVGPKIAIGILSSLPAAELAAAVARGDIKRFQAVPGVGKKIAERLALELKEKVAAGVLSSAGAGADVPAGAGGGALGPVPGLVMQGGSGNTLVDALTRLGFKPAEAERAAAQLKGREAEPLSNLVREALKLLTH